MTFLTSSMLDAIVADTGRIQSLVLSHGETEVPDCPGWTIARLGGHIGRVHRMAIGVLTNPQDGFAVPETQEKPPADAPGVAEYVHRGVAQLVDELRGRDPQARCWNFLNEPMTTYFWFRRMAHEVAVHRHDAEVAVGTSWSVPPTLAVDGVEEYFVMVRERLLAARNVSSLGGTLHLHATDIEGEWMIEVKGSAVLLSHGHGKGDAAIRGTASDLMLGLWGRLPLQTSERFERFGSSEVISALSNLGGT